MTDHRLIMCLAFVSVWPGMALAAQAGQVIGDSAVYRLSPESTLEVQTGKAGILGFAGHEHVIRARRFSGTIVYYPGSPSRSRVEIRIETQSLEVLTPPDTAEIRKVTEAMRSEVLLVDRYPEIVLISKSVAPASQGFHVSSDLTIAGRTREVPVEVKVVIEGDTLRASCEFAVKQTDFGIKPYRGGPAGTVRVADRVKFRIDLRAVRARVD